MQLQQQLQQIKQQESEKAKTKENPPIRVGEIIPFGKHKWRVLEVKDSEALLISDRLMENREYNKSGGAVIWENCTLRKYLNNEFYNIFTSEEKSKILETWLINIGGYNTTDKIFLLSVEEARHYFKNNTDRVLLDNLGNVRQWWLRSPGTSINFAARVTFDGEVNTYGNRIEYFEGIRPALWLKL